MKKIATALAAISILLLSCAKNNSGYTPCTDVSPASEDSTMRAFCQKDTITAVKDTFGLYYQVITPGTGAVPNLNSIVSVRYTGSLLNGTVFDKEDSTISFPLNSVIAGWQIGIPYIKKGGHIKLIIPSAYAYGCTGYASIPPNAILYFDIQLMDVH